jgi:hypothetical protein
MKEKIKSWYEGEFVPHQNDPNSALFFLNRGQSKRHWTANFARWAVSFYMREWKWTLGAFAAMISFVFIKRM